MCIDLILLLILRPLTFHTVEVFNYIISVFMSNVYSI